MPFSDPRNPEEIRPDDAADNGDEETRNEEAQLTETMTSGARPLPGHLHTGDPDLDQLTVKDAGDPTLGLTDIGEIKPEDWAADTGPTRSGEEAQASRRR